jgi:hypothetical protein
MSARFNPNFCGDFYQAVKPMRRRGNDEGRIANGKTNLRGGWRNEKSDVAIQFRIKEHC